MPAMNAEKLLRKVRRHLLDFAAQQQGNTWTDAYIIEAINEEQDYLVGKLVQGSEDWFGAVKNIDVVAGQATYRLFDGFALLRMVEFGGNGTGTASFKTAIENRLIEGVNGSLGLAVPTESEYWYAIWGDELHIQPTPGAGQVAGGRMWFLRVPGPVLYETIASSAAADRFILASTGEAPKENDILESVVLDVISGTGAGQRKRIITYTGSTREAIVDSAFSPQLDSTSKIATVSRVPMLYHDLLHLGGARRLMADLKETKADINELYEPMLQDFEDYIEKRTSAQRGIIPFDLDE